MTISSVTQYEGVSYLSGSKLFFGLNSPIGSINSVAYTPNKKVCVRDTDWKLKVAKRIDCSNPYFVMVSSSKQNEFYASAFDAVNKVDIARFNYVSASLNPAFGMPSNSITLECDDIALKRMKGRLATDMSQFQLLIPSGEIKETRDLIKSTSALTKDCLLALLDLKKMKIGSSKRQLKNIAGRAADVWLQFSFAISPTISDVSAGLKSLSSYMLNKDNFSANHSGKHEVSWNAVTSADQVASARMSACAGYEWRCLQESSVKHYQVRYVAGVSYNVSSGNSYGLDDQFGLSFGAMIPMFWELTPFSWIVDYFTTVGPYLEDVFLSKAGNTIYCTKSAKYEYETTQSWDLKSIDKTSRLHYATPGRTQVFNHVVFERTVLQNIPHRICRIKSIDEIGIHSVNKLLNLAALLL